MTTNSREIAAALKQIVRMAGDPEALEHKLPAVSALQRVRAAAELTESARVHFILYRLIPEYLTRLPDSRDCRRHPRAAVSAGQVAAACPAPWKDRPDLVSDALWLLHAHGFVLVAAGSTRVWKIIAAGRLMLAPRRGPARQRAVIGGGRHHALGAAAARVAGEASAVASSRQHPPGGRWVRRLARPSQARCVLGERGAEGSRRHRDRSCLSYRAGRSK